MGYMERFILTALVGEISFTLLRFTASFSSGIKTSVEVLSEILTREKKIL
jgi:hypothetical protein